MKCIHCDCKRNLEKFPPVIRLNSETDCGIQNHSSIYTSFHPLRFIFYFYFSVLLNLLNPYFHIFFSDFPSLHAVIPFHSAPPPPVSPAHFFPHIPPPVPAVHDVPDAPPCMLLLLSYSCVSAPSLNPSHAYLFLLLCDSAAHPAP